MREFLTPEGRTQIEQKRNECIKIKRPEIAKRISHAISLGDLKENSEYADAKDDLSRNEMEITRLEELLRTAETIDNKDSSKVNIGSKVTFRNKSGEKTYTIVGLEEADPSKGKISYQSPLGQALFEKSVDHQGIVKTPNGSIMDFKIISIA